MNPAVEDVYRLTSLQEGMLLHCLRDRDPELFVNQLVCRFSGPLHLTALRQAVTSVVDAHPVLRTSFHAKAADNPLQVVHRSSPVTVGSHDLSEHDNPEAALSEVARSDRRRGFALDRPSLTRFTHVRLPGRHDVLVWTLHHLLLDGWSTHLVLNDLLDAYDTASRGRPVRLTRRRPYRDYVAWLGRQDQVEAEEAFQYRLGDVREATVLPGPAGTARHPGQERYADRRLSVPPGRAADWRTAAQHARVTLNTLVQAAWGLTMCRFSGRPDVVFGTTLAVRPPQLSGADKMAGVLLNTLPTRIRTSPGQSIRSWLSQVHAGQLELQQFGYLPLPAALATTGLSGGQAVFETSTVMQNYPIDQSGWVRESTAIEQIEYFQRTNDPLTLMAVEGPGLEFVLTHDRDRYADDYAERLLNHVAHTLDTLTLGGDRRTAELATVPPAERQVLLSASPATAPEQRDLTLPDLPLTGQNATETAVVCGHRRLTHGELDARANQFAHWVSTRDVPTDMPVAVSLPCSADTVAAVLGVLRSGRPFACVGPAPAGTHTGTTDSGTLWLTNPAVSAGQPTTPPDVKVRPDTPACVWPAPPGSGAGLAVALQHAVAQSAADVAGICAMAAPDVVLLLSPPESPVAVGYLLGSFAAGATVVFLPPEERSDTAAVAAALERHKVTCILGATAHDLRGWSLGSGAAAQVDTVRVVVCDGDGLDDADIGRVSALFGPHTRVVDRYLPSPWSVRPLLRRRGAVRPSPGDRLLVLDGDRNPVPVHGVGEVYVGGVGLASPYGGEPAGAETGLPDRAHGVPVSGLCRTGDVGRPLPDGTVTVLGRAADQVVLGGRRVDPAAVAARLRAHHRVADAVVEARSAAGRDLLVAYVVPGSGSEANDGAQEEELQRWIGSLLPVSGAPVLFVTVERIPLTRSGQVDSAALAAMDPQAGDDAAADEPRSEEEIVLAGIFTEILGVPRVGLHDSFFDLGGRSLDALRMITQATEALGVEVPLDALFETPTVSGLLHATRSVHG